MKKRPIKIQWLTKSVQMHHYINKFKDVHYSGGMLYGIDAINAIKSDYNISVNIDYIKHGNFIKYFLKKHKKTIDADVCILDPYILAFNKVDYKKYNIAMIHHIDENIFDNSILGKIFFNKLYSNLKKVDQVVVVSKFWKSFLQKKGVKNIKIIYNSYDVNKYFIDDKDVNSLKQRIKLDINKPTIYIGKNSFGKGVKDVLKHIDYSKYNLIASGKNNTFSNKYQCFYLSDKEFPILLKIADIVLSMSTMPEGWNRIAHEAMLVKTPVIGSGIGGMGELLENANQYIVSDFSSLEMKIQKVLANKQHLGNLAFDYVKNLNLKYFKNEWLTIINEARQIIQKIN